MREKREEWRDESKGKRVEGLGRKEKSGRKREKR